MLDDSSKIAAHQGAPFGGALPIGRRRPQHAGAVGFRANPQLEVEATEALLTEGDEGHLMTFAPTGAGKSVSCAVPALLSYDGPAVVVDPKGELAAVTAKARERMGQTVIMLDPFGITDLEAGALNPLDLIEADSDTAVDDAATLAAAIANDLGLKDPFWDERARQLIAQTMLYVATDLPRRLRTLKEVRRLLNLDSSGMNGMVRKMEKSRSAQVRAGAAILSTADPRVAASILSCAQRFIEAYRSDRVAESIGPTSIPVDAISSGAPVTIYMALPPERLTSHAALLRAWVTTLFVLMLRRRGRPPKPTLFLIDEAAQLGRLDLLVSAVTLLRGYGVKTWTFWQDVQQLESTYPREWQAMFNNTALHLAFGRMTPLAAQRVAQLFDTPYERLRGLEDDEALLMRRGAKATRIRRLDYLRDPEFQGLAEDNPRYEPAPVASTRAPYLEVRQSDLVDARIEAKFEALRAALTKPPQARRPKPRLRLKPARPRDM